MQATPSARIAAFALLAFAGLPARAENPALVTSEKLAWRTAELLASDAVAICAGRGYAVVATVVDPAGRQQAMIKGDTAAVHSIGLSYRKAYTAYAFGRIFNKNSSGEVIEFLKNQPAAPALNSVPEAVLLGGGVTIRKADGTPIGGIGVSGAPGGDKDEACAAESVARHKDAWK